MEQFVLLAKNVRGRGAAEIVKQATCEPGLFAFGELLDTPSIQEVRLQLQKPNLGCAVCLIHQLVSRQQRERLACSLGFLPCVSYTTNWNLSPGTSASRPLNWFRKVSEGGCVHWSVYE